MSTRPDGVNWKERISQQEADKVKDDLHTPISRRKTIRKEGHGRIDTFNRDGRSRVYIGGGCRVKNINIGY